jgi:hypothetical protein
LQSEIERKKFGSFLVPLVSPLSFGFCPGTCGALPVFQMVSPASAANAGSDLELPNTAPVATIDANTAFVHSLRLLKGDEE